MDLSTALYTIVLLSEAFGVSKINAQNVFRSGRFKSISLLFLHLADVIWPDTASQARTVSAARSVRIEVILLEMTHRVIDI